MSGCLKAPFNEASVNWRHCLKAGADLYLLIARLKTGIARLCSDRAGNIATIFGLAVLPMLGAVGVAVDFVRVSDASSKLQTAADLASLAGASGMTLDKTGASDASIPAITAIALLAFDRSVVAYPDINITDRSATATIVNGTVTVNLAYTAKLSSNFGQIFSISQYNISSSAQAVNSVGTINYTDFYMVMDVSGSMAIAATVDDQARLMAATAGDAQTTACAFACHDINADLKNRTYATTNLTNEQIARQENITLQIDVMKQAVKELIDQAGVATIKQGQFRFGLFPFSYTLRTLSDLSSDFTGTKSLVDTLDFSDWGPTYGNTYFNVMFDAMTSKVGTSGDGLTAQHSKKYMFLITDGVNNQFQFNVTTESEAITPMSPSACDAIKAQGVQIAVLQTTYPPLAWGTYTDVIQPALPQVQANLQACASPGLYYLAADSTSISTGLQKLFAKTGSLASSRLTR